MNKIYGARFLHCEKNSKPIFKYVVSGKPIRNFFGYLIGGKEEKVSTDLYEFSEEL